MFQMLVLLTFALSEALLVHVTPSLNPNKHLSTVEVMRSLRKLHKRQVEDFGPPDDLGGQGPPDVDGSGNRTGDRPWAKRGGGRRRQRPGNSGHQGCNFRGRRHRRPPTDVTGETSLVAQTDGHERNSLATQSGVNIISNHRGNGRRLHRRGREECKDDGIGGNGTATTEAPSDD